MTKSAESKINIVILIFVINVSWPFHLNNVLFQ